MDDSRAVRWLLVLGSNVDAEEQLDAALVALDHVGNVIERSSRLAGADVGGGERAYLNQLVELMADVDTDLRPALKAIEHARGRCAERMARGLCDLDIDLLARLDERDAPQWLAEKPRQIPAVAELLRQRFAS